jgi:hypothetical protein
MLLVQRVRQWVTYVEAPLTNRFWCRLTEEHQKQGRHNVLSTFEQVKYSGKIEVATDVLMVPMTCVTVCCEFFFFFFFFGCQVGRRFRSRELNRQYFPSDLGISSPSSNNLGSSRTTLRMFWLQVLHKNLLVIETKACNLGDSRWIWDSRARHMAQLWCCAIVLNCWGGRAMWGAVIHHNKIVVATKVIAHVA